MLCLFPCLFYFHVFFHPSFSLLLEIKARALHILGKHSTAELSSWFFLQACFEMSVVVAGFGRLSVWNCVFVSGLLSKIRSHHRCLHSVLVPFFSTAFFSFLLCGILKWCRLHTWWVCCAAPRMSALEVVSFLSPAPCHSIGITCS